MSACAENSIPGDQIVQKHKDTANTAYILSVWFSNTKVTSACTELGLKSLENEMMGDCSNSSILINKYDAEERAWAEKSNRQYEELGTGKEDDG